eukprot:1389778-Pyramimonas_sp.AAC.1
MRGRRAGCASHSLNHSVIRARRSRTPGSSTPRVACSAVCRQRPRLCPTMATAAWRRKLSTAVGGTPVTWRPKVAAG